MLPPETNPFGGSFFMETNVVNITDLPARKPRTKAEILAFLSGHFRYNTIGERGFEDWSLSQLKDRLAVVWDFDQTCEKAGRCFLDFAMSHRVEEETIMVPRKIMVAKEKVTKEG